MTKTCSKCGELKPLDQFRNRRSSKDGKHAQCKKCMSLANKAWKLKDDPQQRLAKKEDDLRLSLEGQKKCSQCHEIKPLSEFTSRKEAKDGKRKECKGCKTAYNAKWFTENREKSLAKSRAWRENHPEKIKANAKKWYWKNRDIALAKGQQWRSENADRHRKNSMIWAKNNRQRINSRRKIWRQKNRPRLLLYSLLHRTLDRSFGEKTDRTHEVLGYSPAQLREHIEKQFVKGMSWDNYGSWHIDHIVSIAEHIRSGERDPAVINCLTNLRPMWAKDNIRKSDTRTHLL